MYQWETKGPISLAETSPRLISHGNSGDLGDQKMTCALTMATSWRRLQRWQPIRPEVAGTSLRRLLSCGNVSVTSPAVAPYLIGLETRWRLKTPLRLLETSWVSGELREIQTCSIFKDFFQSRRCLRDVSETCWRPRRLRRRCGDVSSRSRRRLWDLLETGKSRTKKSNTFEFPATPRRPG